MCYLWQHEGQAPIKSATCVCDVSLLTASSHPAKKCLWVGGCDICCSASDGFKNTTCELPDGSSFRRQSTPRTFLFGEIFISNQNELNMKGTGHWEEINILWTRAASVLQCLVVFVAVPMPLWGSSGHCMCIGERGAKGRWDGVSWEGNRQAACFSEGDRDLLARREEWGEKNTLVVRCPLCLALPAPEMHKAFTWAGFPFGERFQVSKGLM